LLLVAVEAPLILVEVVGLAEQLIQH